MTSTTRTLCAIAALMVGSAAHAQELKIWHDKGDDGLAMVEALSAKIQATESVLSSLCNASTNLIVSCSSSTTMPSTIY